MSSTGLQSTTSPVVGTETRTTGSIRGGIVTDQFSASDVVPMAAENKALFQSFYWLTPDNKEWWNMLHNKLPEFAEVGFDGIWAPPFVKTRDSNIARAGYEPYDYYDLGEFDQQGHTETRYGSRAELENFIARANSLGIGVMADIVINHRVGGDLEYNPFTDSETPTNFEDIASKKLKMNYTHFHPNAYAERDRYQFVNFPDISHNHPYVQDEFIKWGKWLRDEIGFDGWRFDVAHGVNQSIQQMWIDQIGGYFVGEYWFGSYRDMETYLDEITPSNAQSSAFDFFLMYALQKMATFDGSFDLRELRRNGLLWQDRENQSTTFVVNHDTTRDENVNIDVNRHLAYSYILTHEGYPSVFHQDYFNPDLQLYLKTLLQARNLYAAGETEVLSTDFYHYVMQRTGDPGLLYALNDSPDFTQSVTVSTKFGGLTLREVSGAAPDIAVPENGEVTLEIPEQRALIYVPGDSIMNSSRIPIRDEHNQTTTVEPASIRIDGQLDEGWAYPIFMDKAGENGFLESDLENTYLRYDGSYLYVGFSHGKILENKRIQYGVAFDVAEGGGLNLPGPNTKIKINTRNQLPEYMVYFENDPTTPFNNISTASLYSYSGENWDAGRSLTSGEFSSDPVLGFVEFRLPLNELGLTPGNHEISLKVFSSSDETPNAVDSMPQDNSLLASDGNSWLAMGAPISISIPQNDTDKSSLNIFYSPLMVVFILISISKRYSNRTS